MSAFSVTTVTPRYSSVVKATTEEKMTPLQTHTLGVLVDVGTADADEISRHLLVDGRCLGPVLRSLEHRGLIERTYTGHRFNRHAYFATARGEEAYHVEFGDEAVSR